MYRNLCYCFALLCLPGAMVAATSTVSFTVQHDLQVPGRILATGTYQLSTEEDVLQDRAIMRLRNQNQSVNVLLLAVPDTELSKQYPPGIVDWKTPEAIPVLRGWVLPGGKGAWEFAYPKQEAVKLANEVQKPVVAIDPESDKLPPLPSMSKDDLEVVRLWLLSYNKVEPNGPERLSATAYKPGSATEVAANHAPRRQLPHTAGEQYRWMFAGLLILMIAFGLRALRLAAVK